MALALITDKIVDQELTEYLHTNLISEMMKKYSYRKTDSFKNVFTNL